MTPGKRAHILGVTGACAAVSTGDTGLNRHTTRILKWEST